MTATHSPMHDRRPAVVVLRALGLGGWRRGLAMVVNNPVWRGTQVEVGWSFADETIKRSLHCRIEVTGRVPVHAGRQSASGPRWQPSSERQVQYGQGGITAVADAALVAGVAHLAGIGDAVGGLVQQDAQHVGGTARQAFPMASTPAVPSH